MAPNVKEQCNEDELDPPQWLDNAFFTKVLTKAEPHSMDIKIRSFKITPAALKGDHYLSIMFRAVVEYSTKNVVRNKSMIIKTMPECAGPKKKLMEQFAVFENEIGIYTEVLPLFEKYLRDVGDDTKLMATVLYHELKPHKLIVLEDLVPLRYNTLRGRMLNREEALAAYAKLAKWHAVSYKLVKEQPHMFDQYRTSFVTKEWSDGKTFIKHSVTMFIAALRKETSLQQYVEPFEKLTAKIDLLAETLKSFHEYRQAPRADALYVLNHGDFHIKNMMFKYHEVSAVLEDIMLLDYQFSYVGSMTTDLIYSIYMTLSSEQRSNVDYFLKYYFKIFKETLEKIDFVGAIPTYDEYQEQLKQHKYLELFMMISFLPIWPKFLQGELDIETLSDDENGRKMFEDKSYVAEIKQLIPKYIQLGYLDV